MPEKISVCYGWIAKNKKGEFLDESFSWKEVIREDAYIHLLDRKVLPDFAKKIDDIFCIYPAMVVQGQPLFGKGIFRGEDGKFFFPGK